MPAETCRSLKELDKQGAFRSIVRVTFKDKNSL